VFRKQYLLYAYECKGVNLTYSFLSRLTVGSNKRRTLWVCTKSFPSYRCIWSIWINCL